MKTEAFEIAQAVLLSLPGTFGESCCGTYYKKIEIDFPRLDEGQIDVMLYFDGFFRSNGTEFTTKEFEKSIKLIPRTHPSSQAAE